VRLRRQAKDRPVRLDGRGADTSRNLLASVELIEDFVTRERLGALVTLREADPRKQIELQLDLSTRMAAISRLTSGAAHEIKNPLNSIALHLEVLKQKLIHDSAGADEIEVISREIQRLDRVVKSFLDFTRPVELKVEEFDLGRLVAELADLVRLDAQAQGIQVIFESADEVVVRGDRDLLKQALLNVVVNGLQASSSGGTLELRLEGTDDGWLVRIKDNGAGIPEDVRPQIFQLYFSTKGGKGTGIGLAMTFQVVQLHGGTIDVVSEVGQGTEFRILMPTARVIGATPNRLEGNGSTPPEFS
jgi:signal transduction histidine kinase